MIIHNFAEGPSLVSQYLAEMRSTSVQTDRLRFRRNLERLGEIFAYEISKTLGYRKEPVTTPLGVTANCDLINDKIVLATIFRAGVPFTRASCAISMMPRTHLCRHTASTRRKRISTSA